MIGRGVLLGIAIFLLLMLVFVASLTLLPAPPLSPTPTWPQGIDLPDKLPRIPR